MTFRLKLEAPSLRVRVATASFASRQRAAQRMPNAEASSWRPKSGAIARATAPVTGEDWDWVTLAAAPFDLDGKTLADFLAWVTREGGWELRFQNEALARSASTIVINGSVDGLTPLRRYVRCWQPAD